MLLHPQSKSIVFPERELPSNFAFPLQRFVHEGQHMVAVPCRREVCAALNDAGLWPYGPIRLEYDWPAKVVPMEHQRITADYFTWHRKAFCYNQIGTGKAQEDSEPVLTPNGWRAIGDLRVGDSVIGSDGKPTIVTGVFPQGVVPIFKVIMRDGGWTRVTGDHLWTVNTAQRRFAGSKPKVMTTAEILAEMARRPTVTYFTPVVKPVEFAAKDLPIEPYLLGIILGDAWISPAGEVRLTTDEASVHGLLGRCVAHGSPGIVNKHLAGMRPAIRALGLAGCRSDEKFIPADYLRGSVQQRHDLLQGLLDTDGYADAYGVEFSSTSEALVDGVIDLAQSLGGIATKSSIRQGRYGDTLCKPYWRVYVKLPKEFAPFRLQRKLAKWTPPSKYPVVRGIKSITSDGEGAATCISVSAADHLYVTRHHIVTHNTLSALWAMDYLIKRGEINTVLVITTLSTMRGAWCSELDTHFPNVDYTILHAAKSVRMLRAHSDERVKVINHDGVKVICEDLHALVSKGKISLIIVDEGAEFSNASTDKYKALKWVCLASPKVKIWWMTGSPMPHAPTDLWAQNRIICPELVPNYFSHFRDKIMVRSGPYDWAPIKGWEAIAAASTKPVIRFKRDECIDLPPTTYTTVEVAMTPAQKKAYNEMRVKLTTEIATTRITAVNEAVKLGKLLQITCGAIYSEDSAVIPLDCAPKLNELVRLIREAGGVALVFVSFKSAIATISAKLTAERIRHAKVDGTVSRGVRDLTFDGFNKGLIDVIVAHPKTMAHGLTLVRSNVVIWYGPPQSYRIYEQANGRVTRPGQRRNTTIINLVCSLAERETYKRLNTKEELQGLLLTLLETPA